MGEFKYLSNCSASTLCIVLLPKHNNMSSSLPIPLLYAQTLRNLLPLLDDTTPSSSSSYQPTLQKCLDDLHLISRMITSLGIFSDNESLSELSDGAMVFMTISWVVGETESRGGVGGVKDRKEAIGRGEVDTFPERSEGIY